MIEDASLYTESNQEITIERDSSRSKIKLSVDDIIIRLNYNEVMWLTATLERLEPNPKAND